MDEVDRKKMLRPALEMLDEERLWQHMSDGLAIFISNNSFEFYRIPLYFEEFVTVGSSYYLKPILPLISGDGEFYILALSQSQIRLLHATRTTVDDIELEDIPEGIEEMLATEVHHPGQQFHSGTPGGKQGRNAIFHGHGDQEDSKDQIKRYFNKIDGVISGVLNGQTAPLVLAGVDYLHPIYKKVNSYNNIVDEGITGNPDQLSADQIHEQAWEIVAPHFQKNEQDARAKFEKLQGTGKASDKLHDVWNASIEQKIETLFVDRKAHEWGSIQNSSFEVHADRKENSIELLDHIAMQTLHSGGNVYAVDSSEMPGSDKLAAVYRY